MMGRIYVFKLRLILFPELRKKLAKCLRQQKLSKLMLLFLKELIFPSHHQLVGPAKFNFRPSTAFRCPFGAADSASLGWRKPAKLKTSR